MADSAACDRCGTVTVDWCCHGGLTLCMPCNNDPSYSPQRLPMMADVAPDVQGQLWADVQPSDRKRRGKPVEVRVECPLFE